MKTVAVCAAVCVRLWAVGLGGFRRLDPRCIMTGWASANGSQEEDVVGVLPTKDIGSLLPLGDRILIEVWAAPRSPSCRGCFGLLPWR